jgi:DNA-binding NtrC family response regulator
MILVIEDDLDCRDLLGEVLGLEGHKAEYAGTAQEATAAIKGGSFSVVLSDLRVPGAGPNGDIVRIIREAGHSGRVILLSGDGEIREIAKKYDVEFQPKPLSMDTLLAALAK